MSQYMGDEFPYKAGIVISLSVIWIIGLLVLVPLSTCIDRRAIFDKDMTRYPWWQWMLFIPYLKGDANAPVPGWIAYPLIFIGCFLGMLIIVIMRVFLIKELLLN